MLFTHQRVMQLVISAPPLYYESESSFLSTPHPHTTLPLTRSPGLLRYRFAIDSEAEVLEFLRGLPDLKKVTFPKFYLTSNTSDS